MTSSAATEMREYDWENDVTLHVVGCFKQSFIEWFYHKFRFCIVVNGCTT